MISTRWVFKIKDSELGPVGKARLVAKGFMTNNYKETYAPVASITSVRTFLSIAIHEDMIIKQIDVEIAFLNSRLNEDIYIKLPEGLNASNDMILKLNKAIYGLKQSSHSWYATISNI